MPRMRIDSVHCIDTSERRRDEIYFVWAYRYGAGDTNVFVGTYRGSRRSHRKFRRRDHPTLNRDIINPWYGAPSGIQNGVLAVVEEDGREDFNAGSRGVRLRRARRLERYINDRIDAHHEAGHGIGSETLQNFMADGIRTHAVNDTLIGTCPLVEGPHAIRGAGAHYEVRLEVVRRTR